MGLRGREGKENLEVVGLHGEDPVMLMTDKDEHGDDWKMMMIMIT